VKSRRYQIGKRVVNYVGTLLGIADTWALLNIYERPALCWSILIASAIGGVALFELWTWCLEVMGDRDG
jgi:hypothetical protein